MDVFPARQQVETVGDCYIVVGGLMHKDAEGYTSARGNGVDPLHALTVMQFAKVVTLLLPHRIYFLRTGFVDLQRLRLHTMCQFSTLHPSTQSILSERC